MPRLSGVMVKVEYVGHSDGILTEYNGKKYAFTKRHPMKYIPVEVYDFFKEHAKIFVHELKLIPGNNDMTMDNQEAQEALDKGEVEIPKEAIIKKPKKKSAKRRTNK